MKKIFVVMPAFNEAACVEKVVKSIKPFCKNIVVVDDGSSDSTSLLAFKGGATVLTQPVNMGVGFATRLGTEYAFKHGADIVVTIDADEQHPPSFIPRLLEKLSEGYGAVFAIRTLENKEMPIIKRLGNGFLTLAANALFGSSFSDTQTGFKAFTREAFEKMRLESDDYAFCSEFAIEARLKNLPCAEVSIPAKYSRRAIIKGTDLMTGINIFLSIIKWRFLR